MEKPQWRIEQDTWIAEWRAANPLPPMTKRARWRIEQDAWIEMRRLKKRAEREGLKRVASGDTG
jgi:hypothetical protein